MQNKIPNFENIFSAENLFKSFEKFKSGKNGRIDIATFSMRAVENIFKLQSTLASGAYKHGGYRHFVVNDPKRRDIHKASVADRIVHRALYDALYPFFDRKFIFDSYSCRENKGTHRALERFEAFVRKESRNYSSDAWILKCDVRKCFASIDHSILKRILEEHVRCPKTLGVLSLIIDSFDSGREGIGIPLGNLTSQLFINMYLHELDMFCKRELKIKKYIRYADDFVAISRDKEYLQDVLMRIMDFLKSELKLEVHPDKVFVSKLSSGVDFLGWVHFPKHKILRSATRRRMFRNMESDDPRQAASYLGLLLHGNAYKLEQKFHDSIKP